jgi:hypothetical protein
MEAAIGNHVFGNHANCKLAHMQIEVCPECDPLHMLNEELDNFRSPHEINERSIERLLKILEDSGAFDRSFYWLVMARIFELALFCAGNYADNCEFSAAGDLLVNPRKILIYIKGHGKPLRKKRHGRLSELLAPANQSMATFIGWFKKNAILEVGHKALLDDLFNKLETSGRINSAYLADMKKRMNKIADTVGFLASGQITCAEQLIERMRQASPETKKFFKAGLCHFDKGMFNFIGEEIRRLKNKPGYHSPLLAGRSGGK